MIFVLFICIKFVRVIKNILDKCFTSFIRASSELMKGRASVGFRTVYYPHYPCCRRELGEELIKDIFNGARMKDALRLSLIAMLLSVMIMNVRPNPEIKAKLYLDPGRIPGPGQTGQPGDEYTMAIEIDKVEDLCAVALTVKIEPYASVLKASNVAEGDFLSQGGHATYFTYEINLFEGSIELVIIRLGNMLGASGSGTLATFKLTVIDAGESPIDLVDSLLINSNLEEISHQTSNSYYYGPKASLIRIEVLPSRHVKAGAANITFWAKVRSESLIPLWVRVRFDISRMEDGRRIRLYTGQKYLGGGLGEPPPFEYLYCDGYYPVYEWNWNDPGASVVGKPDGNFAESTITDAVTSMYTFEDIDLAGRVIQNVDLYGYTRQPDGIANDFDPYMFTYDELGNPVMQWIWCDSLGGSTTWAWTGGRYYQGGPYDMPEYFGTHMHTQEGINSIEVLIQNWGASGPRMQIDALRWKVEFATIVPKTPPIYSLPPYQEMDLETYWVTDPDHIGSYELIATIEYTATGSQWIQGNQKTLTFKIVDP